jgi:hypothetical protein
MQIEELKSACREAIEAGREAVILKLPNGVRLCGRSGPIGELLCDAGRGTVVRFKAAAVLRWVEKAEKSGRK